MASPLHGRMQISSQPLSSQPIYFPSAVELDTASGLAAGPEPTAQQVCSFYMRTGTCAYGTRCKFYHPHPSEVPPPVLNTRGYPIRSHGEPDCAHFLKKGWCAFGMTCKFNHPEILTGPNLAIAAAQPNMLLASPSGSTAILQSPVVYQTCSNNQAYVQAAQPPTAVYYLPTTSGTFASSMVQPYTVSHEAAMTAGAKPASLVLTQTTQEGQPPAYNTAPAAAGSRAIFSTSAAPHHVYGHHQYIEQPMVAPSGLQLLGGAPARRDPGLPRSPAPPSGLMHAAAVGQATFGALRQPGMDGGASPPLAYEPMQASATHTSFIPRQTSAQQMSGGGFMPQSAASSVGMRARQPVYIPDTSAVRRFMMPGRPGDASTGVVADTSYGTAVPMQASKPQGMMLYMSQAEGTAGTGMVPAGLAPVAAQSAVQPGSYTMLRASAGGSASASVMSLAASSSGLSAGQRADVADGWQNQSAADRTSAAGSDRLVQQLQSLRLQAPTQAHTQPQHSQTNPQ